MIDEEKDNQISDILLRWEEACEQGEEIPIDKLCKDYPDLKPQVQKQIDALKQMSWMTSESESSDLDEPLPEIIADRYQVEKLLGEGGHGRVLLAWDTELERRVAVKIPRMPDAPSLKEEAIRLAKLRHEGIVTIHDVGRDGKMWYIVSDYIDGQSLQDQLANGHLDYAKVSSMIAEIAQALNHAHTEGFIHRDIKPANILLDQGGRPHLTDFGIASTLEGISETNNSGTLAYMAPEQVAGENHLIGPQADIYSLGVVLYESLTGRLPYSGNTPYEQRESILFRTPLPPSEYQQDIPQWMDAVCLKSLSKHPEERFASANDFATALCSPKRALVRRPWLPWIAAFCLGMMTMLVVSQFWNKPNQILTSQDVTSPVVENNTFVFNGFDRIVTPLERFAPVTLEAWVRPDRYEYRCHYVIGSDVPTEYGIGMGICGVLLTAEYIPNKTTTKQGEKIGSVKSKLTVPIREWSHIATVFGEKETRLYFNGKLVETGPPTKSIGGTSFVIGNVGKNNPVDFFLGQIRSIRISKGGRFTKDFIPDKYFTKDDQNYPNKAILIYDGSSNDGEYVTDLSGEENHGIWERFKP